MWLDRTKSLLGEDGIKKLQNASVTIVGVGGVGGEVAVLLARAGVGRLRLIDFDVVDETNINRQAVAYTNTVGKKKTDVLAEIIKKINPNCLVEAISKRLTKENVGELLENSFVVDAIDSVQDKVELIDYATKNNLQIVSAMGAGNRFDYPYFKVVDIYKTSNDGLAKVLRKKLKERGVKKLQVVAPESVAQKISPVGSISYYPVACATVVSAYVVNQILAN